MKPHQHTTLEQAGPTLGEMGTWVMSLNSLHQRLRPQPHDQRDDDDGASHHE